MAKATGLSVLARVPRRVAMGRSVQSAPASVPLAAAGDAAQAHRPPAQARVHSCRARRETPDERRSRRHPEFVLALSQSREAFDAGSAAKRGHDRRCIHAQERIAGQFLAERHRQAWFTASAQRPHPRFALGQRGIVRLDAAGEGAVGERVFVAATDACRGGQGSETIERGKHLRRTAFEQAATAEGNDR